MRITRVVLLLVAVALATSSPGEEDDGAGAHFRLTVLIEMDWDEGDMYRTYFGTADLVYEESNDSTWVAYCESYRSEHGEDAQAPDFLGTISGSGHLGIEGSGSSGDVFITYEGTADVQVTGYVLIDDARGGQILDVTLSGTTDELWTVHNPDGSTFPMPQTHAMTPKELVFRWGHDEIEINDVWDEGTTREVYSLAMMEDPFQGPW